MRGKKPEKRRPFRDDPLRSPGQSLQERRDDLLAEEFVLFAMLLTGAMIFCFLEWYRWFVPVPPHPILYSGVVFVDWFVEPVAKEKIPDVWLLNQRALPSFIEHEPRVLPQHRVMLAHYHLSQYPRSVPRT